VEFKWLEIKLGYTANTISKQQAAEEELTISEV
jgi:hypothetical protein